MKIVGNFKGATIEIFNLLTDEDSYHFKFDIKISTYNFSLTYHFSEIARFHIFDFIDGKQKRLVDENNIDSYLEMSNEYFEMVINQDCLKSSIKIIFEIAEDKVVLEDFLLTLKSICEVI